MFAFYTSIRQLDAELDVSYRSLRLRVEQFARTLDAPAIDLVGPVEIDELYMSEGLKGRKRDSRSRSRGLSKRGRGSYGEDKPPVFTLVDRGSDQRYVVSAKSAGESTVRLLLGDCEEESLTVYTDGFRAYDPLEEDENLQREAVIHGDGEYVDGDTHVNTCESHASRATRGSRRIEASRKTSSRSILEPSSSVGESYVNPVKKLSKTSFELCSDSPTTCFP